MYKVTEDLIFFSTSGVLYTNRYFGDGADVVRSIKVVNNRVTSLSLKPMTSQEMDQICHQTS